MLSVGNAVSANSSTTKVRNASNVPCSPHTLEDGVAVFDAKIGPGADAFPIIQRDSRATEHRVGLHARGPNDDVSFQSHSIGQVKFPIHSRGELSIQVNESLAFLQVLDDPM